VKSSVLVVKAIALRVNIGFLVPAAYNVLPDTTVWEMKLLQSRVHLEQLIPTLELRTLRFVGTVHLGLTAPQGHYHVLHVLLDTTV